MEAGSKSAISTRQGRLYMVNFGYGFMGYRKVYYGKPFIAAFDTATGKQLFRKDFDKKENINDIKFKDGYIYVLFEDKIFKLSEETGIVVKEKTFDNEHTGKLSSCLDSNIYIYNNGKYTKLEQTADKNIYVTTSNDNIAVLNSELVVTGTREFKDFFGEYETKDGYNFLYGNGGTIIIKKGEAVGRFKASPYSTIIANTLYDRSRDNLSEIDLSKLLVR